MAVTGDGPLRCAHCEVEAQSAAGLASHVRNRHADLVDAPTTEPDTEVKGKSAQGLLSRLGWKRKPTSPRKPARRQKRVSGTDVLAIPFDHGAQLLGGTRPCTANVLRWEAPWAAYVLDEALAGTLPDRLVIQPLARNHRKFAMVESVLGPIALVYAMESRPSLIPTLMPEIRRAFRRAAPSMLKAIAAKRVEDAEIESAFRETYPTAPEGASADDMIDTLLAEVFAPMRMAQEEEGAHEPVAA